MNTEYYDLLGVSQSATDEEIKKAYRKKAMTHHPDKGGDKETFQKIQEAYETLSDNDKRKIYDRFGKDGVKEGGMPDFDPFAMFDFKYGPNRAKPQNNPTIIKYYVDLEDIYNCTKQKFEWKRKVFCQHCQPKTCAECKGVGMKINILRQGNFIQQSHIPCNKCFTNGVVYDEGCEKCKGSGVNVKNMKATFQIQKGVYHVVLEKQGDNTNPNRIPGNVIIELLPKNTMNFTIQKDGNLIYTQSLGLYDALTGFEFDIPYFNKQSIHVKMTDIIQTGQKYIVGGKGMCRKDGSYGDIIVAFDVKMPEKLLNKTDELKKLLQGSH